MSINRGEIGWKWTVWIPQLKWDVLKSDSVQSPPKIPAFKKKELNGFLIPPNPTI